MPFFYEDRAFQLFIACASGRTLHACLVYEMYVAIGVLEARLVQELKLDDLVAGGLVADVDPDGTAAAPLRFFPANNLSAGGSASQLKAATAFRQALSNMVTAVDEEIKELRQKEG
jgi:hypothetical protein